MKKSLVNLALVGCLSPFLIQCVASEKEVTGLDLRLRTLDARTTEINRTLSSMKALPGSQADMANQLDKLKARLLQLEAQLEEKSTQIRKIAEEQIAFKKSTSAKLDQLAAQTSSLNSKVDENSTQLLTIASNLTQQHEAQAREAADEASIAVNEAEKAWKKAQQAGKAITIEPEQAKKKVGGKAKESAKAGKEEGSSSPEYDKALATFKEKNYEKAYDLFLSFIEKNPKSALAPNARFWLGECLFQQKEYELAILEYQKVIADYPKSAKVPAALLKQGHSFEKLNEKETAKIVYSKILSEHPGSEQVEAAKKRLSALE